MLRLFKLPASERQGKTQVKKTVKTGSGDAAGSDDVAAELKIVSAADQEERT